jgi:hypothetical protein
MKTAMLKAQAASEKQDLVYGQTLIDEVKAIKADAERLQLEAEGRRDIRAALQAIRERVGIQTFTRREPDGGWVGYLLGSHIVPTTRPHTPSRI